MPEQILGKKGMQNAEKRDKTQKYLHMSKKSSTFVAKLRECAHMRSSARGYKNNKVYDASTQKRAKKNKAQADAHRVLTKTNFL